MSWVILTSFCGFWLSGFLIGQAWERKKWRLTADDLPVEGNPKFKKGDLLIVLHEKE